MMSGDEYGRFLLKIVLWIAAVLAIGSFVCGRASNTISCGAGVNVDLEIKSRDAAVENN